MVTSAPQPTRIEHDLLVRVAAALGPYLDEIVLCGGWGSWGMSTVPAKKQRSRSPLRACSSRKKRLPPAGVEIVPGAGRISKAESMAVPQWTTYALGWEAFETSSTTSKKSCIALASFALSSSQFESSS